MKISINVRKKNRLNCIRRAHTIDVPALVMHGNGQELALRSRYKIQG
ncbi:MAG: hypothetical protein P8X96_10440 [Desulfobacteraceae bacterium]